MKKKTNHEKLLEALNYPSRRFDVYVPKKARKALIPSHDGWVVADFGSGNFPADGTMHEDRWTNNTGKTLYVQKAIALVGPQLGATADLSNIIYRLSDHLIVAPVPLDISFYRGDGYYARPFEWNGKIVIKPGDGFFNRCYSLAFKNNDMFGIPLNKIVSGFRCFVWMTES
jgi:hypothetical protein